MAMDDASALRILPAVTAGALLALGVSGVGAAQDPSGGSPQDAAAQPHKNAAYLTWSGKAQPAPAAPAPAAPAPASPAPAATASLATAPPAHAAAAAPASAGGAAAQSAAAASDGDAKVGARLYSLHREYGLDPDPVTIPKQRPLVLIAPPDPPPSSALDGGAGADDGVPDRKSNPPDGEDR
jgi:hypothetical protein